MGLQLRNKRNSLLYKRKRKKNFDCSVQFALANTLATSIAYFSVLALAVLGDFIILITLTEYLQHSCKSQVNQSKEKQEKLRKQT